jgi:hypothetical protein
LWSGERSDGQGGSRVGAGLLPELEDDLTGGHYLSVSGKGKKEYPFGVRR